MLQAKFILVPHFKIILHIRTLANWLEETNQLALYNAYIVEKLHFVQTETQTNPISVARSGVEQSGKKKQIARTKERNGFMSG